MQSTIVVFCMERLTTRHELKSGNNSLFVLIAHILCLESCHGYTLVYLTNGDVHKQSSNIALHLKALESSGLFFRTYRSHVVNIMHVTRIENGFVVLSNGQKAPIITGKEHTLRNLILNL